MSSIMSWTPAQVYLPVPTGWGVTLNVEHDVLLNQDVYVFTFNTPNGMVYNYRCSCLTVENYKKAFSYAYESWYEVHKQELVDTLRSTLEDIDTLDEAALIKTAPDAVVRGSLGPTVGPTTLFGSIPTTYHPLLKASLK